MKRFGWLWSGVAGAVVLPLLMSVCAWVYLSAILLFFSVDSFLAMFSRMPSNSRTLVLPACLGALLGANTWALWKRRSSSARMMGAITGVVATAVAFVFLWRRLETPVPPPLGHNWFFLNLKQEFILHFCLLAPTLLWAWTLVFAAPFVRSSPEHPKRELALNMAASAVAGAVLLPLLTGIGVNIYLLQTGQNRLWLRDMVSLFWMKLPLAGAVFGALTLALYLTKRGHWLRGSCIGYSLAVAWVMWRWFEHFSPSNPYWRPPNELLLIIAAPTMFWALGLLFFALVARSRRALIQTSNTE